MIGIVQSLWWETGWGGKVMLQILLATAWEMKRMGSSGVRAFILVLDLRLG